MNQSSRFRFTSQWKSQAWQLSLLCGAACMVPLAGCGGSDHGGDAPVTVQPTTQRPTDSESSAKGGLTGKIKFKAGQGDTEFSVKPQDDGAKLVDSDEQEIARFNLSDSKLKVKDADDTVLGYVIASPGKYKIKNSAQDVELWQLQRQDDGDWKLEDGQEKLIYKIKKREYGFEIEDAAEKSMFKVKLKDGKTSLRDASEQTVFYTKDEIATVAVACLGLEAVDSLPLRTALMTMLIIHDGR